MANEEQLALLKAGVEGWNKWRKKEPNETINLSGDIHVVELLEESLRGSNLRGVNLSRANLRNANLRSARLSGANLSEADLTGADLRSANLSIADLTGANLSKANLTGARLIEANLFAAELGEADLSGALLFKANLCGANLYRANLLHAELGSANLSGATLREAQLSGANLITANLTEADLSGADLITSNLVEADITNAKISKSKVYGVNVWGLKGEFKEQKDLVITLDDHSPITVDNIKVAQFVYLILNNKEIRDVINTLTSKTVLILGRFALPECKAILDALRNKLREYDLLPIVFDFDRPADKDFTETIKTLAGISYFVIADVTNPKSSPLELQATVPDYQFPFVPIIQEGESPFAMMVDLQKKYPWVLPTRSYDSIETLMAALKPGIIDPAVEMRNKLRQIKAQEHPTESLKDYLDKTL